MSDGEFRVDSRALREFTREVFIRVGVPPEDADTEAELLIWANLRGVDSHGVHHIPRYVASLEAGDMNAKPNIRVLKETPATVSMDADRALGPVVTFIAMNSVMKKAKEVGVGWDSSVTLRTRGLWATTPSWPRRTIWQESLQYPARPTWLLTALGQPGVHNSPIAIAVPGKRHPPLILDMATSVAAGGKVVLAIDKGISMPEGWSLDKDGNPTTDPKESAMLLPFAAPRALGWPSCSSAYRVLW